MNIKNDQELCAVQGEIVRLHCLSDRLLAEPTGDPERRRVEFEGVQAMIL